jgi:predicted CoA-binding protein
MNALRRRYPSVLDLEAALEILALYRRLDRVHPRTRRAVLTAADLRRVERWLAEKRVRQAAARAARRTSA